MRHSWPSPVFPQSSPVWADVRIGRDRGTAAAIGPRTDVIRFASIEILLLGHDGQKPANERPFQRRAGEATAPRVPLPPWRPPEFWQQLATDQGQDEFALMSI